MYIRSRNDKGEFVDFKVKSVTNEPNGADLSIVEVLPTNDGKNIDDNMKLLEFASQEEIKNIKSGDKVHIVGYPGDKEYGSFYGIVKDKLLKIVHSNGLLTENLVIQVL